MTNIYSKGAILLPRQLRSLNGKKVMFMTGEEGNITYPYILIKRKNQYHPVNIENKRVFQEIKQVKNGRVILAERVNHNSPLYSTGKGRTQKK